MRTKKFKLSIIFMLSILLIAGCGQKKEEQTSVEHEDLATQSQEENISVYIGKLKEDVTQEDDAYYLPIIDIESVSGENELQTVGKEGLVLLVSADQLTGAKPELITKGTEIEFSLISPVVMTRSMPPQIPGDHIKSVYIEQ